MATVHPTPFLISQYRTPQQYLDPAKMMQEKTNMKIKKRQTQGKFKPSKSKKQFFIDQLIVSLVKNPSPDKYKTTLNLLQKNEKGNKINNVLKPKARKNTY